MELRTLRYFVAVAEAGSVSGATRHLHVSQPSLSRQVHQLERELGLVLFIRRDGRLVLSPAGQQFLPAAREVLVRAARARAVAERIRSGAMPSVAIAAPAVTTTDVLAPFFATLSVTDPMPRVLDLDPADEYAALDRGADVVIGTRPPPRTLVGRPVAELPVHAYVPAAHPWAGRRRVPLAELAEEPLLLPPRESHARRALDVALDAEALGLASWTEVASSGVAQAVAAAGRGVAVVSDDPRFGLHAIAVDAASGPLRVRLYAAWQPHHPSDAQLADLIDRLRAFVGRRYADAQPSPAT